MTLEDARFDLVGQRLGHVFGHYGFDALNEVLVAVRLVECDEFISPDLLVDWLELSERP